VNAGRRLRPIRRKYEASMRSIRNGVIAHRHLTRSDQLEISENIDVPQFISLLSEMRLEN